MDLSTILLACAVAAGLGGGMAARYRRPGTDLGDLATGAAVGTLIGLISGVVAILAAGLDTFGIIHLTYLLLVVGVPIGCAVIALPHLFDRAYRTPLVAWLLLLIGTGLVAAGIWGTHIEPRRLVVDRVALGATGAQRPVVIGVIADLQTPTIGDHERRAVDEVLAAEPDIVLLPGDLFELPADDFPDRAPEFIGLLRRLTEGAQAVVIVEGDNDTVEGIEEIAEASGAVFLRNQILDLDLGDQRLTVVGLSTPLSGVTRDVDPLLLDRLDNSYDEDDLVLILSHAPDPVLSLDEDLPVDLVVAGHTHGGQVALPVIGPLITFSDVPRTVAAGGLHLVNSHPIFVSTGVGMERGQAPQLRFGVPPSVGVVTIVPE